MRILMLGPSDVIHFRRLVRGLADRGHAIHVMSMKPDAVEGATFERFRVPPFGWQYPFHWRRRWKEFLSRQFSRHDVACVHFVSDWGITAESVRHTPLVVKAYGSDVDPPPQSAKPHAERDLAKRRLLRAASRVVTSAEWFREKTAQYGRVEIERVVAIPMGVETRQFIPPPKQSRSRMTVGFYKGFEPVYGPLTMVEVAAYVCRRHSNVRFEFIGSGPLLYECIRLADELELNQFIHWRPKQEHGALPGIMSRWDVVAIPSVKESFCVAALEAGAMELPVVASAVGGLFETVEHGRTGTLTPQGDVGAMGEAILDLLNDPERRRAMGEYARRRVQTFFEWSRTIDAWEALLTQVMTDRSLAKSGYVSTGLRHSAVTEQVLMQST